MGRMVSMNLRVSDYTSRVLGVIKEKYGLKDKSEALDRFAGMYGDEFVEKEVNDEYVKKILKIEEDHFKKYGFKTMTDKEMDELFGK